MGVAQKRDFYRVNELTELDILLIKRTAIETTNNRLLREANIGWIDTFQRVFQIRRTFDDAGIKNAEVDKAFDEIANNLEEDLHSSIEEEAIPCIDDLLRGDISFFSDDNRYMGFCHFIAVQYLRTNKIKQNLIRNCEGTLPGYIDRAMGAIRHIYATNMAWSIFANRTEKNFCPTLLINNSSVNLIAGDQPVINTHAVKAGYAAIVDDVEFYYPISPNTALIISQDDKYRNGQKNEINAEQAGSFNNLIAASAEEQIYGQSKADLEPYISLIPQTFQT